MSLPNPTFPNGDVKQAATLAPNGDLTLHWTPTLDCMAAVKIYRQFGIPPQVEILPGFKTSAALGKLTILRSMIGGRPDWQLNVDLSFEGKDGQSSNWVRWYGEMGKSLPVVVPPAGEDVRNLKELLRAEAKKVLEAAQAMYERLR